MKKMKLKEDENNTEMADLAEVRLKKTDHPMKHEPEKTEKSPE